MQIVNFGHFTTAIVEGILCHTNGDGQDWYDLRRGLTSWDEKGAFVNAIFGAWALIDPATMLITYVDYDPSRLVPDDKIVLGIDADPADVLVGMRFDGETSLSLAPIVSPTAVDIERDRRIDAGFVFQGASYQSRPSDRENIAGAATSALYALIHGADPDDYAWHGGSSAFQWITADNSTRMMDAETMVQFGRAAMAHKQRLIFAARALKEMTPIPLDYSDDSWWQ